MNFLFDTLQCTFNFIFGQGHVDPGEYEAETALREVQEETGIKKTDLEIYSGFEKVLNVSENYIFSIYDLLLISYISLIL